MTKKNIFKSAAGKKAILEFYQLLLKTSPVPFREHWVQTPQGNTYVLEFGDAKASPLILLHGSSSNSAMWLGDISELVKKFRVLAVDIIGECGLSAENRPLLKSNAYSNWLLTIYNEFKINQASIIGCSLGGWLALDFSMVHPERVTKLILMATGGVVPIKATTLLRILLVSLFGKWGFQQINRMVYHKVPLDDISRQFTALIQANYNPRTEVLPVLTDKQLEKIKASVLFIGGAYDCFYNSRNTASRLAQFVPNFQDEVLKDNRHVLLNQTQIMMQFLVNN